MQRISNCDMASYVNQLDEFRNHNGTVIAQDRGDIYVVQSYGEHFPMYVYDYATRVWFGNTDKYSRTTSTHQNKTRPDVNCIQWTDTNQMRTLVQAGSYAAACADRITEPSGVELIERAFAAMN